MTRQLAPERPAAIDPIDEPASPTGMVAAAAAVRGAAVAVSGGILAAGLALVLWAVTPASGADPAGALQGGVVAFAAANLMPVMIAGVEFTLPPLLLTMLIVGLLAGTARRGRFLPQGRYQELVSTAVTALVYGLAVAAITRGLGPAEAVPAGGVWTAAVLALAATAAGMLGRGSSWRRWCSTELDARLRLGVRGGVIGLAVLLAGGGLAVTVGLVVHFGSAVGIAAIAAPSWSDGLGMAMLGLAFLPNAVVAGAGYVTGVGFEIGPGTYSPLASATVDLPAVPLLAAAPDQSGRSLVGLTFLAVPVIAGYLIARTIGRHLSCRLDFIIAGATAGVLTGALLGGAAAIACGGIGDGRWSVIGAPPLLVGAIAAAEVGIVAVAAAAVLGGSAVPWRSAAPGVPAISTDDSPDVGDSRSADVVHGAAAVHPDHDGMAESATAEVSTADPTTAEQDTAEQDTAKLGTGEEDTAADIVGDDNQGDDSLGGADDVDTPDSNVDDGPSAVDAEPAGSTDSPGDDVAAAAMPTGDGDAGEIGLVSADDTRTGSAAAPAAVRASGGGIPQQRRSPEGASDDRPPPVQDMTGDESADDVSPDHRGDRAVDEHTDVSDSAGHPAR